ncbi:MAG: IS21 family transposase, partial [Proteobacteria bacterium]|nr:IS21 family transposase [Pseudomonadota bacterium]
YTLIGKTVEIGYDAHVVQIYVKGKQRVASHIRTHRKGEYITDPAHMPRDHKNYLEWTPERIKKWGAKIGPATKLVMEKIMETRNCPEYGFRGCLGIVRLSKVYTPERVDDACKRALSVGGYSYKSVQSILKRGLDNVVDFDNQQTQLPLKHSNIRGQEYYKEGTNDRDNHR